MIARTQRIGLGTVQWGLDYGVTNAYGQTPTDEVGRILSRARTRGIDTLDTAALYGEAEAILGAHDLDGFNIITKTPRFGHAPITQQDAEALCSTLEGSLEKLRVESVSGLLVHHADDLISAGGEHLLDALSSLKASGKVRRIGVSVYTTAQVDDVLSRFTPDLVQLPVNVFDQRLITDGTLSRLAGLGVEIHARSAYLQGLLLTPANQTPDYFSPWRPKLDAWQKACVDMGTPPQLAALAFVCDHPEVSRCLIGVQNLAQFESCLCGLDDVRSFDASTFASNDPAFLDPSRWQLS
ncbi:aldo/keto reductase [Denitromonas sp.]|uniref:aldo/keto reductase n=1 Tax=Denitromonas sp. TaxID=2734609 RepID=UPI003A857B23